MAKSKPFTEEWLREKNYIKSPEGDYVKAIDKVKESIAKRSPVSETVGELTVKAKVNNSPDFIITTPVTEWFIKNYSVPSKKNSRQNFVTKEGRQLSIPSKKHAEYVKMTAMQYNTFGIEFRNAINHYDLKFPLHIEFMFIRATKHSFDYANVLQTCEDIMKDEVKKGKLIKKGWFPDDSADYIIPVFKQYEINKEMPGVRIRLIKSITTQYF